MTRERVDLTLGLGEDRCSVEECQRLIVLAAVVSGQGLQHQHLDDRGKSAALVRGLKESLEQLAGIEDGGAVAVATVSGEQDLGKGDVLELPQVGEVLRRGHVMAVRPANGGIDVVAAYEETCGDGVQWSHVG